MIELVVDEFCHNCPEFEPYSERTIVRAWGTGEPVHWDTTVTCQHIHRCRNIKEFIGKVAKNE